MSFNKDFDLVVNKLKNFFRDIKGYKEIQNQNELSIVSDFQEKKIVTYNDSLLPLPQTEQLRLENDFLTYPNEKG